jgi:hypothetical protein
VSTSDPVFLVNAAPDKVLGLVDTVPGTGWRGRCTGRRRICTGVRVRGCGGRCWRWTPPATGSRRRPNAAMGLDGQ